MCDKLITALKLRQRNRHTYIAVYYYWSYLIWCTGKAESRLPPSIKLAWPKTTSHTSSSRRHSLALITGVYNAVCLPQQLVSKAAAVEAAAVEAAAAMLKF